MRQAYSLVLVALVAAACHTMRPMTREQLSGSPPPRVWVTAADRVTVRVEAPELNGDTLTGIVNGEPERIPLTADVSIRALRSAPARTAIVSLVVGGATFAGLWAMEHRRDVGDAQVCTNGLLDMGVVPGSQYIPCCLIEGTSPC